MLLLLLLDMRVCVYIAFLLLLLLVLFVTRAEWGNGVRARAERHRMRRGKSSVTQKLVRQAEFVDGSVVGSYHRGDRVGEGARS